MARRLALVVLALAPPLAVACLSLSVPGAPTVFALLATLLPPALILLAVGGRRLGLLGAALGLLTLLLAGGVGGLLLLRGRVEEVAWVGGLPASAALLLWGLWVAPLVLVSLVYALTFRRHGPGGAELDALRRRFPPAGGAGPRGRP